MRLVAGEALAVLCEVEGLELYDNLIRDRYDTQNHTQSQKPEARSPWSSRRIKKRPTMPAFVHVSILNIDC